MAKIGSIPGTLPFTAESGWVLGGSNVQILSILHIITVAYVWVPEVAVSGYTYIYICIYVYIYI